MKCVSIRQPWASAILAGLVDAEYRCYSTDHRGELLIYASPDASDEERRQLGEFARRLPRWDELEFGQVIGVVDLWACEAGPHGEWVWRLRDPRPLEPFDIEPGRKLFDVEDRPLVAAARSPHANGTARRKA